MVKNLSQETAKTEKPVTQKTTRGKHPMPALLRVPCTVLFMFVLSLFFTWFIFWQQNLHDVDATWEFIKAKPILAEYSFLIIFCLLAVITSITWRPFFSAGFFFCIISVVMFINTQKFTLRSAPLLPEEFKMADSVGNLIDFIDIDAMYRLIFGVIFVLVGSILAEYYLRKFLGRDPKKLTWWDRMALIPRATFSMISLTLLFGVSAPIIHRRQAEWLEDLSLVAWSQTENYSNNGFVIGFLYNLGIDDVAQPDEYNAEMIHAIAKKYQNIKIADATRKDWTEVADNIVIILSETFYDPALLTKYYDHNGGDVTPFLHQLFKKYPSGYMYSPEYGGNTANVEFEVQTGLSNYWAMSFPYVNYVPKLDNLISAAQYGVNNYGFGAVGLHSYDGTMYKRHIVYRVLGYPDFIDQATMRFTEYEYDSEFINEKSFYNEILALLEDSDVPQVIGGVSMQNHMPYAQAHYPKLEFTLKNKIDDWYSIESNFQSLHEADKYLKEFIEALDDLDERTIVLWFGDHAAALLNSYFNSGNRDDYHTAHLTPYFIYANFDFESPYTTREVAALNKAQGFTFNTAGVDLPTQSPNCLLNTMYNTFNLSKPALYYLIDEVCTEVPILTRAYQGNSIIDDIPAIKEYQLVNYDLLNGEHYWDGM